MIAWIDAVLLLLLGCGYYWMPDAVHPTLPFGVRVPPGRERDPAVSAAKRTYRQVLAPLTLAGIALALLNTSPIVAAGLPALFLLVAYGNFYVAHRAVRAAKLKGDWYAGQRTATVAQVGAPASLRRYPWGLLAVAALVIAATAWIGVAHYAQLPAILPTHFGANGKANGFSAKSPLSAFLLVIVQIVQTAGLALLGYVQPRMRQDLDPAAPVASLARHRAFQVVMTQMLVVLAIGVDISLLLGSLRMWAVGPAYNPMLNVAPVLIVTAYAVWAGVRVGQGGNRMAAGQAEEATGRVHRDDDAGWIGGAIYFNRSDPAFLVPRRFGVGWTLNFGHPTAWIALVALVALIIAVPSLRHR